MQPKRANQPTFFDLAVQQRGSASRVLETIAREGDFTAAEERGTTGKAPVFGSLKRGGKVDDGIEDFWNQAKRHLRKFKGVPKEHFPLSLKEGEWRFNNPNP